MARHPLPPPGIPLLRGPSGGWLPNYYMPQFDFQKQILPSSVDSASESSELSVCPPSSSDSSERGSGGTSPQSFAASSDSAGDLQMASSAHVGRVDAAGDADMGGTHLPLRPLPDRAVFNDRSPKAGRRLSVRVTYGPGCAGVPTDGGTGGRRSSREEKCATKCYQMRVAKRSCDSGDATSSDFSDFENHMDQQ